MRPTAIMKLVVVCATSSYAAAETVVLHPIDVISVRWWNAAGCDGLCGLNGMGIDFGNAPWPGFEDRTMIMYDVSAYDDAKDIKEAIFDFLLFNFDPGPPVGVIDIYAEGKTIDELPLESFFDGKWRMSFENDMGGFFQLDVTDLVREGVAYDEPHLFLRFSTVTSDIFAMGTIGISDPTLIITTAVAADLDADGDVDLNDAALFQNCFTGQGAAVPPACEPADLNADGAVDLTDHALFLTATTGPA
ncbi:MAG: dockerin type I domain-containing protein [Phycisphaerae bacterium]